ncbi:hypothetical protein [Acinetobacter ursingii]|uniref:hypothetical protein n=1 Tax=Acinetobacter ursingii TaxID=108980 RepID=UPI00066917FA|nr:hypothetical protein [Acinetobacter ursingii]
MTQNELIDQLIKNQNEKREKLASPSFMNLLSIGFVVLFFAFLSAVFVYKAADEMDYQEAKAKAYQQEFNNGSNHDLAVFQSNTGNTLGVVR